MAPVAVAAVDVDGTLVGAHQRCSDANAAGLRRAAAAGIDVVFVTARPARTLVPLVEGIGLVGSHAICSLGAVLCELPSGAVLETWPLSLDAGRQIVGRLRAELGDIAFGWETGEARWHEPHYPFVADADAGAGVGDAATDIAEPLLHLFARHATADPAWMTRAAELTEDLAEVATWTSVLVDFTAKGVTKLTGLQRYCRARGVAAEQVVAIGDMPVDVPMLQWAGIGVAVADAHRDAIAAADRVVAACDADGVAAALDELVRPQRAVF